MTFNVEFLNSDEFLKNDDKGVDLIKFFVYLWLKLLSIDVFPND